MTVEQIINKILLEKESVSRETLKEPTSVYLDEDTYKILRNNFEKRFGYLIRTINENLTCLGLIIFIVKKPGHKLKNYIEVK